MVQASKAEEPITFTVEGIVMEVSFAQFWKHWDGIFVIEPKELAVVRLEHPKKVRAAIVLQLGSAGVETRDEHPSKAEVPTAVTLASVSMLERAYAL